MPRLPAPLVRSWTLLLPPAMFAVLVAATLAASGPVAAVGGGTPASDLAVAAAPSAVSPGGHGDGAPAGAPVRFASYQDLELFLPSTRALISGFHEASYPHALRLRPWGTPLANDNPRKDAAAPTDDGPNYAIMSTRDRPTQATSAVDVAVPHHAPIASPVSGRVVEVTPYALYGRYADTRIRIRPADRPDLLVTVLHLSAPAVRVGDDVVAGRTRIAGRSTAFPFRSHVDAYAGGRPPHVHIELRRA